MNRRLAVGICLLSTMFAWHVTAQDNPSLKASLTNPSFEEPLGNKGSIKFVKSIPGWKTTDTEFEIWSTGFEGFKAHAGDQFVELNAHIDGTLYQDSMGIKKGSVLEFTFAHRGRNGKDTMKLTITDLGPDNALGGSDDTVLFTKEYSTGKEAWAVYNSTKEPRIFAMGNTVRFAYSAVHGTGGKGPNKSEGNFLDDADFGVGVVTARSKPSIVAVPQLPTEFIVQTYGIGGQGNQDQTPAFIGIEDGKLRIIELPLEQARKNEKGVQTITRVKLDGGLVALKVGDRYLPDFAKTIGPANQYREVAPVFPPKPGEKDFISLESAHEPGKYLRHFSHNVFNGAKNANEVDRVFQQDVTWHFHSSGASKVSNVLAVPTYAQQTSMWCWATGGEMIMKYHDKSVAQCTQANDYYTKSRGKAFTDLKINCCGFLEAGTTVDERIVLGGWPQYQDYGFTFKKKSDSPLSFAEIKAQIDANQPIGFAWWWTSPPGIPGGGHYMVLTGYKTIAGVPMVKINDPWPNNVDKESNPTEHTRWLTYDYWCNSAKHTHGPDHYDIIKNP